jgi:hypothetical protein
MVQIESSLRAGAGASSRKSGRERRSIPQVGEDGSAAYFLCCDGNLVAPGWPAVASLSFPRRTTAMVCGGGVASWIPDRTKR